jgi:ubiquinone/menaquinone biosynthesis C-methylase UbiE
MLARLPGAKGRAEMTYWIERKGLEGTLTGAHYEEFFTTQFGLSRRDYEGRLLDIGCGPRGSLEWATGAAERVGVDPLVDRYRQLGIDRHAMRYVKAGAERLPFPDGHFDVVSALNSLDHVDDAHAAVREMTRVTRPGGIGLVLVEVGHSPTPTEPQQLEADEVLEMFNAGWTVAMSEVVAMRADHQMYKSWSERAPTSERPALLGARLLRRS